MEISNAPRSSSYITWWTLSNPHHTLSKYIRGKRWKIIICSPQSICTLHLQQESDTHITVSCCFCAQLCQALWLEDRGAEEVIWSEHIAVLPRLPRLYRETHRFSKLLNSTVTKVNLWLHHADRVPSLTGMTIMPSSWQFLFYSTLAKWNLICLGCFHGWAPCQ